MLGTQDPIRNALRDLVRGKQIWGWNTTVNLNGDLRWLIVLNDQRKTCPAPYTTEAINDLIGMFWKEPPTP